MKSQHFRRYCTILMPLLVLVTRTEAALFEGDVCIIKESTGTCKRASACPMLEQAFHAGKIRTKDIPTCRFTRTEEIICCPNADIFQLNAPVAPVTERITTPRVVVDNGGNERPAVKACKEIEAKIRPSVEAHVLGGTPVGPGEFPHMAAIGYLPIGAAATDRNYEFSCGGTLIAKRFVLTAAHCLVSRARRPAVVRLGVTDIDDAQQLQKYGFDATIQRVHIHHGYSEFVRSSQSDDIAVIQLEEDVPYTATVFAACLHTDTSDPDSSAVLTMNAFGTMELNHRLHRGILMKAQLASHPLAQCRLDLEGHKDVLPSHLCTVDPNYVENSCEGNSGGPLNLQVDRVRRMNHVVGIAVGAYTCGAKMPNVYVRVASYVDFIESIVWPGQ